MKGTRARKRSQVVPLLNSRKRVRKEGVYDSFWFMLMIVINKNNCARVV